MVTDILQQRTYELSFVLKQLCTFVDHKLRDLKGNIIVAEGLRNFSKPDAQLNTAVAQKLRSCGTVL